MDKLNNIEILNYRSCVKTKIDLNENLTVLIGINGSGKSNILSAIHLLKYIGRNRLGYLIDDRESISKTTLKFDLLIDNTTYQIKVDIFYEVDARNVDEISSSNISFKITGEKKWKILNERSLKSFRSNLNSHFEDIYLDEFKPLNKIIKYLVSINYYSANQFSDPTKCPISIETDGKRIVRSLRDNKVHEKFVQDLYTDFKFNTKSFEQYINIVNQNGIGIIENLTFIEHTVPNSSYKVKTGGKIQTINTEKNIIIPSVTVDGLLLSLNQLSEGTFKTLALIFYILNDKSNLLLIEEPEVFVHHGLLNSIIELIKSKSKDKQIIISTHSDHILDKLKPENILLIKKNKEDGTSAKALLKSLSRKDYKALKSYLNDEGNLGQYWLEGGLENE